MKVKIRCAWLPKDKPDYTRYHDTEWGRTVHDDQKLFEMLILEGAQAGLSWYTILKRRDGYRKAFKNFDVAKVARMTDAQLEHVLATGDIIRNRLKVLSARKLIINDLTVHNGQVSISQASLGSKQLSAPLPAIHLTGIGQGSGGATAGQVAEQVINSISGSAARAAITELAKEKVSGALGAVPGSAIGGAAAGQVGTQLKGIFGQ